MASAKLLLEILQRRGGIVLPESRRSRSLSTNENPLSVESVLTKKNRESCVRKLKLLPSVRTNDEAGSAAVLVPLCRYRGELGFLYTLRSPKLNSNGGQVSFPGGKKDESDENPQATALRETWEELGIARSRVDVWSTVNPIGRRDLSVTPVFGYISDVEPDKLEINRDEVEETFVVSLQRLCDPGHFRFTRFRNGLVLPTYTGGKHRVWGLTAAITHMILKALVPSAYKNEIKVLPTIAEATDSQITNKNNRRNI